jgi:hypothetical protein
MRNETMLGASAVLVERRLSTTQWDSLPVAIRVAQHAFLAAQADYAWLVRWKFLTDSDEGWRSFLEGYREWRRRGGHIRSRVAAASL